MVCVLQLNNMELTKHQSNVMAALKQGNDALKKAQQEVRSARWADWCSLCCMHVLAVAATVIARVVLVCSMTSDHCPHWCDMPVWCVACTKRAKILACSGAAATVVGVLLLHFCDCSCRLMTFKSSWMTQQRQKSIRCAAAHVIEVIAQSIILRPAYSSRICITWDPDLALAYLIGMMSGASAGLCNSPAPVDLKRCIVELYQSCWCHSAGQGAGHHQSAARCQ